MVVGITLPIMVRDRLDAPIRSIAPVRRRSDLDWGEFSRHWQEEHAEIARSLPGMSGYVQGHAIPEEQPPDAPSHWRYDGCPFAAFSGVEGIAELRSSDGYRDRAVPDESAFLDRDSMRAVLMAPPVGDGWQTQVPATPGRTLLVFAREPSDSVAAPPPGQPVQTPWPADALRVAVEATVSALPGADEIEALRWSAALNAETRLSPGAGERRPFDALLEARTPTAGAATRVATALASLSAELPWLAFCLVVREMHVF